MLTRQIRWIQLGLLAAAMGATTLAVRLSKHDESASERPSQTLETHRDVAAANTVAPALSCEGGVCQVGYLADARAPRTTSDECAPRSGGTWAEGTDSACASRDSAFPIGEPVALAPQLAAPTAPPPAYSAQPATYAERFGQTAAAVPWPVESTSAVAVAEQPLARTTPRADYASYTASCLAPPVPPPAPQYAGPPAPPPVPDQMCVVRDPQTASPMFTMKISGEVASSLIQPEELVARRSAMESLRRLPQDAGIARRAVIPACSSGGPQLEIDSDPETGKIRIDAANVEVIELLSALSSHTGQPIVYTNRVESTLSAKVEADGPADALQRMLEPFGFAVHVDGENRLHVQAQSDVTRQQVAAPPGRAGQTSNESHAGPLSPVPLDQQAVDPPGNVDIKLVAAAAITSTVPIPAATHYNRAPSAAAAAIQPAAYCEPAPPAAEAQAASDLPASHDSPVTVAPPASTTTAENSNQNVADAAQSEQVPATTAETPQRAAQTAQDAFAAGQNDYAMEVLTEGVIRFPSSDLLLRLLGEAYFLRGDYPAATVALTQALAIAENHPLSNELMGKTLLELGKTERGRHYLMRAKSLYEQQAAQR